MCVLLLFKYKKLEKKMYEIYEKGRGGVFEAKSTSVGRRRKQLSSKLELSDNKIDLSEFFVTSC